MCRKLNFKLCQRTDKIFNANDGRVLLRCLRFNLTNEVFPLTAYLPANVSKQLNRLILVHFLMQCAVESVCLGSLPALVFTAAFNHHVRRFVLSEVQAFSWMNFTSDCNREVFVRYSSIPVSVKLLEEFSKSIISYLHTPVV